MDEVYDQQITQFLQKIDENFVLANKAAALLLRRVKVFEQRTGEVAESLDIWCRFFDYFHPQDNIDEEHVNDSKDRRDSYGSFQSGSYSHMSTPSMPRFSKSFHKTPMARSIDLCYPASAHSAGLDQSFASASTNLSRDLKNITPPTTTPFYKPSKSKHTLPFNTTSCYF
uniref:DASH complex subunit ASK1 n=1 Tax=Aplanochytrium stocchinoi TaxID=215587 RepID=A0A7S3PF90_9STRA